MWAATIGYLSTRGQVQAPVLTAWLEPDKLAHAVAYFLLSALLLPLFRAASFSGALAFAGAFVVSSAYGAVLEWVQYWYFPDRFFEVPDIIANISGSLLGCLLASWFFSRKQQ